MGQDPKETWYSQHSQKKDQAYRYRDGWPHDDVDLGFSHGARAGLADHAALDPWQECVPIRVTVDGEFFGAYFSYIRAVRPAEREGPFGFHDGNEPIPDFFDRQWGRECVLFKRNESHRRGRDGLR